MMRVSARILILLFIMTAITGCFGSQHRNLASQAVLIEKGKTKNDVLNELGSPNAVRTNERGLEEWYYYEAQTRFWHKIPFWEKTVGPAEVDALQVVLKGDKVVDIQFYIPIQ